MFTHLLKSIRSYPVFPQKQVLKKEKQKEEETWISVNAMTADMNRFFLEIFDAWTSVLVSFDHIYLDLKALFHKI